MAILYSTDGIHPRDRLSYWLDVATRAFVRHDLRSSAGSTFTGRIRASQLVDLGVASVACDPCEVGRSARHAAQDDSDYLLLSLLLEGQCTWDQDCRQAVNAPGNVVLLDTRRPFLVSAQTPTRSLTLTIPRFELEARIGNIAELTSRTFDVRDPAMGIMAGFLTMLPDRMDALDGPTSLRIAGQALDLVALALTAETQKSVRALSSSRGVALLRLKSVIEARLADPDLRPGTAASAAGLSVRYANELLSLEGTSIERYIVARRLERCRRALEDPAQAHRTIGDIAFNWGFTDLSHFGRRFKAAFGLTPRDYRRGPA